MLAISSWLYQLCRGVDHEKVKSRQLAQSVGCGKNFLGPEKLHSAEQVHTIIIYIYIYTYVYRYLYVYTYVCTYIHSTPLVCIHSYIKKIHASIHTYLPYVCMVRSLNFKYGLVNSCIWYLDSILHVQKQAIDSFIKVCHQIVKLNCMLNFITLWYVYVHM